MKTRLIVGVIVLCAHLMAACACHPSRLDQDVDRKQCALLRGLASQSHRPSGTDLYAVLDDSWNVDTVLNTLWYVGHTSCISERRWSLLVLADVILGLVPINEPLRVSSREADSSIDHFLIERYETEADRGRKFFAAALLRHRRSHVASEYCARVSIPGLGETVPVVDRDYAFLKRDSKQ